MDKVLYKCDICGEIFLSSNDFVVHRMTHTDSETLYKCKVCGQSFWELATLLCHEKTHEKPYKCTTCAKSFSVAASLLCHTRIHTGERPYVCDVCQKTFTQAGHLQRHKRIHTGVKPYLCDICQNSFIDLSSLIRHRRRHTGEKPYHCDICNKSFTQSTNFVFHKRIHSGERPYSCNVCEKTFIRSCDLLCHKRTHTGEKPYTCETCNKSFSKSSSLVDHERTHTGQKPYQCNTCGKAFAMSGHLVTHKRIHTGERPFKCEVCQKQFTTSSGLVCHRRIHTGDKPYSCDLCDEKFCQLSHVLSHKRRRHGVLPYQCGICSEGFMTANNLQCHKQMHSEADQDISTQENLYACHVCGMTFHDSSSFVQHEQSHTAKEELEHGTIVANSSPLQSSSSNRSPTESSDNHNVERGCDIGTPSMLKTQLREQCLKLENRRSRNFPSHLAEAVQACKSEVKSEEITGYSNKAYACSHCNSSFTLQLELNDHECQYKSANRLSLLERKVSELVRNNAAKCASNGFNTTVLTECCDSESTNRGSDVNSHGTMEKYERSHFDMSRNSNVSSVETIDQRNSRYELESFSDFCHTNYVCSQCNSCFISVSLLDKHQCVKENACKQESDSPTLFKECMYANEKQDKSDIEEKSAGDMGITCVCSQCGCCFQFPSQLDQHLLQTHGLKTNLW